MLPYRAPGVDLDQARWVGFAYGAPRRPAHPHILTTPTASKYPRLQVVVSAMSPMQVAESFQASGEDRPWVRGERFLGE